MPVNLSLAPTCLAEMPSPGGGCSTQITQIHDPDVNEWSGLLVNEQEVAIHPAQAVDQVDMTSNSNAIELTPLWSKNSPNHHTNRGWPADHKSKSRGDGGQKPPPPPIPTSNPPAVPQKSKNHPPAQPPPLPTTSSKDYMQRKLEANQRRGASGVNNPNGYLNADNAGTSEPAKGPAPQPPSQQSSTPVTSQPLRSSSSVSRGLQVEEEDLIQFSNGQKAASASLANGTASTSVAQLKKELRERLQIDEDLDPELNSQEDEDDEETASARTADEQMDYLESLEPCPCYAKCCLDSIITLFCVTLLG